MTFNQVIHRLQQLANPEKVLFKKEKYNIETSKSLGIYHKDLNALAKEIGANTSLGFALTESEYYEARLLGSKILRPKNISIQDAERWITMFDTWEICDSFCMGLFSKTTFAEELIWSCSKNEKEFEKRAAFATLSSYCMANKNAPNSTFEQFVPLLIEASDDNRMYVKKAVNWALRSIGKRNRDLNTLALETANTILKRDSKAAKWIAKDAIKELSGEKVNILDYPRNIYRK